MPIAGCRRTFPVAVTFIALALASPARAQPATAQEREAAAEAYDRGTSAWLARDYAQAASFFETAHRLAPTPAALMQAVRSHTRAGHDLRAATLAARLADLYPDEPRARDIAQEVLGDTAKRFVRVEVQCEGCTVDLDGTILEHPVFFVTAGEEHVVTASFWTGERREPIQAAAGETVTLSFEPPPAPQAEPVELSPGEPDPDAVPAPSSTGSAAVESGGSVPPWLTITALVATVGLGGATLWSGLDALAGVEEYEAMPTREALDEGQKKERRTNALIGTTAGMAVASLVMTFFTDWKSHPEETASWGSAVRPEISVGRRAATLALRGRWP